MKYIPIVLLVALLFFFFYGKGGKVDEPYDGGHGIGFAPATIHQIDSIDEEGWSVS